VAFFFGCFVLFGAAFLAAGFLAAGFFCGAFLVTFSAGFGLTCYLVTYFLASFVYFSYLIGFLF
jgi:hypothetical protein